MGRYSVQLLIETQARERDQDWGEGSCTGSTARDSVQCENLLQLCVACSALGQMLLKRCQILIRQFAVCNQDDILLHYLALHRSTSTSLPKGVCPACVSGLLLPPVGSWVLRTIS